MLKSAFSSPKIRTLAARLGIPFPQAIGMCGMLWNFAADHAPRGNVGKHSDFEIACAVEWPGDPTALVAALVACRLIDEHPEHRLLVHDWAEHCPRYVHATLSRKGLAVIGSQSTTVATTVATTVPTTVATTFSSSSTSASSVTSTSTDTSTSSLLVAQSEPKRIRSEQEQDIGWSFARGWSGITDDDRTGWSKAYPSVDIDSRIARADMWLRANPRKASRKLWREFLDDWLANAHDRGGDKPKGEDRKRESSAERQARKLAETKAAWGIAPTKENTQ